MKITQRKDGLLQTSLSNPRTGKRIYLYARSESELNKKLRKKQKELARGEESNTRLTLASCIDSWFETHKESGIAYHTIDSYRKPVQDCKDYFGNRKISDILPLDIDEFIQFLANCGFARQTINMRYIVLCKTFDWAIKNRVITQNSARQTALPRGLKQGERKRLTTEQVKKINSSGNIYAMMLLYTGTRRCECLALKWEDIDFDSNEIYIHQQLLWITGERPQLAPLKTRNSQAYIPLLEPLAELLKPLRKKSGFIFSKNGQPLTARQFSVMWKKFKEEIGEDIVPHQFRHEYISMLHDAGIDVKSAQTLARHSKFETTMNIYTELEENANTMLGNKINKFLTSESQTG